MKKIAGPIMLLAGLCITMWQSVAAQKITAEQVIAKSLDALAPTADRAKIQNITAVGDVGFSKTNATTMLAPGRIVTSTEDDKFVLAMAFQSSNYQQEKVVVNGKNMFVAFSQPGLRSILGDYLFRYDNILKHGLFGGVYSKNWPLYDPSQANAKISYDGNKKIEGHDAYVLKYEPKKGSDVTIKLFFNAETGRHIRTEYKHLNPAGPSSDPATSSSLSETHEDMTEEFSDFRMVNGITMPRTYKVTMLVERNRQTYQAFYITIFKDVYFNTKLDAATFDTK
ncbi:MAG TPA: hypothetical protein VGI80_06200 [Pyrinomonadaceae bacterium]